MSDSLVIDTDVLSFLFKGDTRAEAYRGDLEGKLLALSFMTVAELYQWAYVRSWGEGRLDRLERYPRSYVVLPYDNRVCKEWARIRVERQLIGRPISTQDAWIAATAVRHRCPLVTHNRVDYAEIKGLAVLSHA
jgi:tRNA(fMet)-specific endonuclease VapC